MTPAQPKRSPEEVTRLGQAIFDRVVRPKLKPEDDGNFAVIDLDTEDFEVSPNEWDAIERLSAKNRGSHLYVIRIGKPYRLSWRMRFPR
jgi:hypothetical protein